MELVIISKSHLVMGPTMEVPILEQFSLPPQYFGLVEIDVDFCITHTVIISTVCCYLQGRD
jgi:hypothetical protein